MQTMMKQFLTALLSICTLNVVNAQVPNDVYRLESVSRPKIAPEGNWILFSQSKIDSAKDRTVSKLYMMSADGKETITLTEQTKGVGNYQWSPDGKYISYLSKGINEDNGSQIFLMDRRGGEGVQLSDIKGEIQDYVWFNNGKKMVMVIKDFNYADTAKSKVRKPYEISRYKFKQDNEGYLDNRKTHLYVLDVQTKKLDTLTRGNFNESDVAISSDDMMIAYTSNVTSNPDKNSNTDLFLLSLTKGATPLQFTNFKGANNNPVFSPDNTKIAFLQSNSDKDYDMYDLAQLGIYDIKTNTAKIVSSKYDRSFSTIYWSKDGQSILSLIEDDRKQNLVQFNLQTQKPELLTNEMGVYSAMDMNDKGDVVLLYSNLETPNEIYSYQNKTTKRLTHLQDRFVATIKKGYHKGFQSTSSDGTLVSGILHLPDSNAKNLPLILFIHGGPVAQDDFAFDLTSRIYAEAGYAVANVNYRGSSGRGLAYVSAISGDWGNKEVKDIIGAADYLIKEGIADPNRLGIAGWSYGGILSNYTIATDKRFKAAVSGAGSSLMISVYGSDQYIAQYEAEIGKPWENPKKWEALSYPFFKVKEIKAPTLFMASQADFNVPVIGAEQMYQAFKSEGIPTELIIYPNQNHGIRVPSYIVHRHNAHINWFNKYLK
jgi:dipeptidyl aminopeptidase/acylaminoacyl peptidase